MDVAKLHDLTGIAVDLVIIGGAIATAIRFRIFNVFGYRWRTDVTCGHTDLPDRSVIFVADYVVNNTGRRPLKVTDVTIELRPAVQCGELLEPDSSTVIARRVVRAGDKTLKGLFQIEPGERTIFPLRARLADLDHAVFVICTFATPAHRTPTVFRGFYVRSAARPINRSMQELPSDDVDDDGG